MEEGLSKVISTPRSTGNVLQINVNKMGKGKLKEKDMEKMKKGD